MFSIGVVARQTGIEIATLRKWEQRYGFPKPVRLGSGQRRYLSEDIKTLLVIARRLDNGERVGEVIQKLKKASDEGKDLLCGRSPVKPARQSVEDALAALVRNDLPALRAILEAARTTASMAEYVEDFAGPLTRQVGERWADGSLPIFSEHMYSAALDSLLMRDVIRADVVGAPPTVLLTTPAGEQHTLGLSMVNAVLCEAGVASIRLHGGLPVSELSAVVDAYRIKVVGVSATCVYPPKILASSMKAMRCALPPEVQLWFGGDGVNSVSRIPAGVKTFSSMYELSTSCRAFASFSRDDLGAQKARA